MIMPIHKCLNVYWSLTWISHHLIGSTEQCGQQSFLFFFQNIWLWIFLNCLIIRKYTIGLHQNNSFFSPTLVGECPAINKNNYLFVSDLVSNTRGKRNLVRCCPAAGKTQSGDKGTAVKKKRDRHMTTQRVLELTISFTTKGGFV